MNDKTASGSRTWPPAIWRASHTPLRLLKSEVEAVMSVKVVISACYDWTSIPSSPGVRSDTGILKLPEPVLHSRMRSERRRPREAASDHGLMGMLVVFKGAYKTPRLLLVRLCSSPS